MNEDLDSINTALPLRKASTLLVSVTLCIAILVLLGWQLDVSLLRRPLNRSVAMNPLTALCFALCALTLYMKIYRAQWNHITSFLRASAALVLGLVLMRLSDLVFGSAFSPDTILYPNKLAFEVIAGQPNSMAPNTAVGFVLISLSILLSLSYSPSLRRVSNILSIFVLLLGCFPLIGYIYSVQQLYGILSYIPMAVHTAVGFVCLALAMLLLHHDVGFMRELMDRHLGGSLARVLIPATIIIPIALGYAHVVQLQLLPLGTELSISLFVVTTVLALFVFVWYSTTRLNSLDKQREAAQESLLRFNQELEAKIELRTKELQQQETSYRAIFERSYDAVILSDASGRPFFFSPATQRLIGWTVGDFQNHNPMEFVHRDDRAEVQRIVEACIAEPGSVYSTLHRLRTSRGDYRLIDGSVHNLLHEAGVSALVFSGRDVTETRRIDEQLRKSDQLLNEMSSLARIGGWEVLLPERTVQWTDEVFRIHELELGTVPDIDKAINFYAPEARPILSAAIEQCINTGEGFDLEVPFITAKGRRIWVRSIGKADLVNGKAQRLFGVFQDISARKIAEEQLQQSMHELASYQYALDEASIVAITDQRGIIQHVNDNFCRISQYSREELIGQDHRIINSEFHPPEFIRELWTTIAHGKIWRGEIRNRAKDGSIYWVDTTIVPFLNEQRKPYQYVAIRSDITKRKKAEEDLIHYNEELSRSNKELEQFAYIASHDLQEPLRMVSSYVQLLQRRYQDNLDNDAREFIAYAVDGAARMKTLINDLLNYSRIGRNLEYRDVDLNLILQEVQRNLATRIRESKAEIVISSLPHIHTDYTQMVQLFQNMLSNALKFQRKDVVPRIELHAERQGKKWLFTLQDNGIGIDEQYAEQIYVVFRQLHDRGQYSGTGIGLATVKKIIEHNGGKIWFESELGRGTTFYFTLEGHTHE